MSITERRELADVLHWLSVDLSPGYVRQNLARISERLRNEAAALARGEEVARG